MRRVSFRDATLADLAAIVSMYADDELGGAREDPNTPIDAAYVAAFEQIDRDPRHRLIVAIDGYDVVGTLQLSFLPHVVLRGGERAQIEAVRVRSDQRGTGLGTQMLEWAIERARERGCRMVQLTSNLDRLDARRFYERLGFEATHVGLKLDLVRST